MPAHLIMYGYSRIFQFVVILFPIAILNELCHVIITAATYVLRLCSYGWHVRIGPFPRKAYPAGVRVIQLDRRIINYPYIQICVTGEENSLLTCYYYKTGPTSLTSTH